MVFFEANNRFLFLLVASKRGSNMEESVPSCAYHPRAIQMDPSIIEQASESGKQAMPECSSTQRTGERLVNKLVDATNNDGESRRHRLRLYSH